jgi:C4-type Zn-finger protein
MSKRRKEKNPIVLFKKRSLDEVIQNFKVTCFRCGEPLVIHGYKQKNPHHGQKEMIYAHCENNGSQHGKTRCPKYNMEICFIERFF